MAIIDIGKTNAKVAVVDLSSLTEVAVCKTPNHTLKNGLYPHADVDALWDFILESLKALNKEHGIDAINVTTHGATAALVTEDGQLALPVLDYEFNGPNEFVEDYNAARPDFSETGSPRLPIGLNLGAQIYWQQRKFLEAFSRAAHLFMYPQYWSYRLSGVAATEVTSLGCHTDLWSPHTASYSTLVENCGWTPLMPPLHRASDALGPLLPEISYLTGIHANTPVYCGIHDSNASLVPHLLERPTPCAVVSTGTWVIAMALGNKIATLDPRRDTLLNISAFGKPVPSSRFMGGREYQSIMDGHVTNANDADVVDVLDSGIMLLPSIVEGSGPFPDQKFRWIGDDGLTSGKRQVAASFYLALMTATCLELIGAEGDIILEGPLAANKYFLDMLTAATGRPVFAGGVATTGTTMGAALLVAQTTPKQPSLHQTNFEQAAGLAAYAEEWRNNLS